MKIIEVTIDNKQGAGAVPYNQDVDYFGLRVEMKPSMFLKLAAPLGQEHSAELEKYIADGGAIGAPFLDVVIPPEWDDGDFSGFAKIQGHEGRNRMTAILKLEGDAPIEVHIFPKGGYRARDLTADYINRMQQGMFAEKSTNIVRGPLFGHAGAGVTEAAATGQYAKLYHSTPLMSLDAILQSGYLSPNRGYLSLTRDSKLDYGSWAGRNDYVEFDIDQNAVRQRIKLEPYNHSATLGGPRATGGGESEERTKQKLPLKGFVTAMHAPAGWEYDKTGEHYSNLLKKYGIPIVYDIVTKIGEQGVAENFADGRNPQDKGDSQRHGIPKGATMAELEKASHAAGRKGQLARWQLNMRRGQKKATEGVVNEGGWASVETQNTVITPAVLAEAVEVANVFAKEYNDWQAKQQLDLEIKMGRPKGSGTYYERDLKQDPTREYGDIDIECFIHGASDLSSAQRIAKYKIAITDFALSHPDYSTENGTNITMNTSAGPVQVDLIYTYHEHANWSRALSPEYRVKGVISTSLTSAMAEVLNLSFSTQGLQVKTRGGQPVSFRQSKDTQLHTVSLDPENWAADIYKFYYTLINRNTPDSLPDDLKAHSGLKDEQRLSDIVLAIKSLAAAFEADGMFGQGPLAHVNSKRDMMSKISSTFADKLEAVITSSKFDKAATPNAVEKADKTKLMLAKYRNEITKLLLN